MYELKTWCRIVLDENSDFPIRTNTEINILKVPFFSKPQGKKRCNFSKKKTWVGLFTVWLFKIIIFWDENVIKSP